MNTREPAPSSETPLGQDLLYALRYYLGGRRAWLAIAALAGLGGLILNWSWLVAIGIAPVLIAILPCAAMCALGLCMNRMMGGSCSSAETARTNAQPEADTSLPRELAIPPLVLIDEPGQLLAEAEDSEFTEGDAEFAQAGADDPTVSDGLTETTTERS
jgi:hypothetical protein